VQQAIDNSEIAVGMIQTAESALTEVNTLLIRMRQLAAHAANEGANDRVMLQADQSEIDNALNTIDQITLNTQFGIKRILDGSQGANGATNGTGLQFIGATAATRNSPVEGYAVRVQRLGSRAFIEGRRAISRDIIDGGEELTLAEGGRTMTFRATPGDTPQQMAGKFANEVKLMGLQLDVELTRDNTLKLTHKQYGSSHGFAAASSSDGILSREPGLMQSANPGQDIQGSLGGHVATGAGQTLTGGSGTPVEGLAVLYTGETLTDADAGQGAKAAGRVSVYQNSLAFQIGANVGQNVAISLNSTNTRTLGRGVDNRSGFKSLRDLNVLDSRKAQDAMQLLDAAVDEVTRARGTLGAFQKNTLEANLQQLRIASENLISAESTIRDADMAAEVAEFTRHSIMVQSSTAMLSHANAQPRTILTLLG
jgi:flagellin